MCVTTNVSSFSSQIKPNSFKLIVPVQLGNWLLLVTLGPYSARYYQCHLPHEHLVVKNDQHSSEESEENN